jgi:hydrogenase maturation protein HypF
VATAALVAAGAGDLLHRLPMTSAVEASRIDEVARLAQRPGWPLATGAGRLFEACGALLGLAVRNSWEGEAAVRLESLAAGSDRVGPWPEPELDEALTLPSAGLLAEAGRRLLDGETPEAVAAGFHATFSRLAVELTERVAGDHRVIALGGGCMVNRLLLRDLDAGLRQSGLEPLLPRQVPPGDGGLAYGQAVLATVAVERGVEPVRVG